MKTRELSIIILLIDEMIGSSNYAGLSRLFKNVNPAGLDILISVAMLRCTAMVRGKIDGWTDFLDKAAKEIEANGKDPFIILRGLQ